MKEPIKRCPHCNAKMVEYPHSMSKSFVRAFLKVIRVVAPGRRFSFGDFPELSVSEYNNLHKLQYWRLIIKAAGGPEKGGDYMITDRGMDFICGKISIPKKVWTYRNIVQRFEGEDIFVGAVTGGWKYRPEYAKEAIPHHENFAVGA